MNGILVIRKPRGMTSHDVVATVRRILRQRRVGHTGTLDPDVAGVLVLCLGSATRLVPYMEEHLKGYLGELWLGRSTDTQDASGKVLEEDRGFSLTDADLEQAFSAFQGEIQQVPPMVSALKHKGQRLYALARQGKVVERKPRPVTIYQLSFVGDWQKGSWCFGDTVCFDVVCSKGTYIRTLCQDIGSYLGVPAHMSSLIRTKVGPWSLADGITLDKLQETVGDGRSDQIPSTESPGLPGFFPMDWGIRHLSGAVITQEATRQVRHGVPAKRDQVVEIRDSEKASLETTGKGWTDAEGSEELLRIYDLDGEFLGIGRWKDVMGEWQLQPVRLLPWESDR
ncbi:MAG: tRNA pseudouridine(55) synthase TruB [Firmicutes bacterium]|nr:tRNA pseudouridine(55) synthase TruB [Bacillota bacterium]